MRINRIIYVALLLLSIIFLVASNDRRVLILSIIIIMAAVVSYILMLVSKSATLLVDIPKELRCESDATIKFTVKNKSFFSNGKMKLFVTATNHLFSEKKFFEFELEPGSTTNSVYEFPLNSVDCGRCSIEFSDFLVYDILGLWHVKATAPKNVVYSVYPKLTSIDVVQSDEIVLNREGDKYDLFHKGNDSYETFALREYQQGDMMNAVHWKLSSKLDKMIIREYSNPANDKTTIYCDCGFPGFDDNHHITNSIFSMIFALSTSLANNGIDHRVCACQGNTLISERVIVQQNAQRVLDVLLDMRLMDALEGFSVFTQSPTTEKSIVVTGALNEKMLQDLGMRTDLTVILIDESNEFFELRANYKLIALPTKHLEQKIRRIDI